MTGQGVTPSVAPPTTIGAAGVSGSTPTTPTTPTQTAPTGPAQQQPTQPAQMQPAQMQPAMQPTMMNPPMEMPAGTGGIAMDECGLDTQFPGDEYCIKPPPADKGFQVHLGPRDYNNPEPNFIMEPGTETTVQMNSTAGNDQNVFYYWRQYRMRPGSHHWIVTANGVRIGGTSSLAKDNPDKGEIAPENQGVGMQLAAHAALSHSLHYFNFTDKPIIKEVWMNVWYRDASEVTEPTIEVFSMLGMGISPGEHVVKHGSCAITEAGRMLTTYGHVHAHNKRFSVWRKRGSETKLLHESYDWEHPNISEFSSLAQNPPLDPAGHMDGGFSGVVDLEPGDSIEFECDILNDTNTVFVGQNEAENDEMCILIGDTVGASVPPLCTPSDLPATN